MQQFALTSFETSTACNMNRLRHIGSRSQVWNRILDRQRSALISVKLEKSEILLSHNTKISHFNNK
jgi:hypothetical protein